MPGSSGETGASESRQFVALAVIWGCSFVLIKLAERSFAPLQVAFGRVMVGAVTLALVAVMRRQRLPASWRTWGHLLIAGALVNAIPFALFAYGEQHVSSVLAGIWNATTPLFTLPVAIVMIADERLSGERVVGLLIGFVGVLTVLGIWRGVGATSLEGNLLCLGAAVSYGLGFPYTRRYLAGRPEGPLSLASGQLICACVPLAILTALITDAPRGVTGGAVLSLLALGALGTGVAYILNYALIRVMGATRASTVTYVIPVFSTIAGIVLLSEPITVNQPVGTLVILLGAAIAQGRLRAVRLSTTRTEGTDRAPV